MENAAEALKTAFAVFVFVLALTLAFSVYSQARSTADIVFEATDNQKYYDSDDEELRGIFYEIGDGENRIVSIEAIIPALYRYSKESYGVTIVEKDGTIVVRYDVMSDSMINSWKQLKAEGSTTYDYYITYLQENLGTVDGKDNDFKTKNTDTIFTSLFPITGSNIEYGAPWAGIQKDIVRRINADVGGTTVSFGTRTYKGIGLLSQYKRSTFREYIKEVTLIEGSTIVGETGDSITLSSTTKKIEIIYVEQ